MNAIIKRIRTGDDGTFGTLLIKEGNRELTLCTAELPWKNNQRNVSCIPIGTYTAKLTTSARFGVDLYEIKPVYGRSGIRIHFGNFAGDTTKGKRSDVEGCILVGMRHGNISGQRAVTESRTALAALHKFTGGKDFTLTILDS